jgi:threonine aldolase
MMINLISDTVTKPTPKMLEAMMHAKVGDDVFKSDPTVNALQEKTAKLFGMEDALFFSVRHHGQPNCHKITYPAWR